MASRKSKPEFVLTATQVEGLRRIPSTFGEVEGVHHKTLQALVDRNLVVVNSKNQAKVTAKGRKQLTAS